MNTKRFSTDINLDDEHEVTEFIRTLGNQSARQIAKQLNFHGPGSVKAAGKLSAYAWNKFTAIKCRREGKIVQAQTYELICDTLYRRDIQPNIECW